MSADGTKPISKENSKKSKLKPIAWALLGGTAALAGASGALWGVTAAKWSDYESKVETINSSMDRWDFSNPSDDNAEKTLRSDANELDRQISNLNKAAVAVSIATGVVAAATTVVWVILKRKNEAPPEDVSVGLGGLAVRF